MTASHYLTCLWPGLPELWWRGRLSGLYAAISFAVVLNSVLVLRFLYPDWLPATAVRMASWVGLVAWAYLAFRSLRSLPQLLAPRSVSPEPDRYQMANQAYLKGDYLAAEPILLGMLAIEPRDPASLLLLSGVYRHTQRPGSARILIQELNRLEIADHWHLEIAAEVSRIERDMEKNPSAESKTHPSTDIPQKGGEQDDQDLSGDAADLTAA